MLHDFIGNDAFRKGMHEYLTKHSYRNTETSDLWKSLEDASQKPVGDIMKTWTGQMGFPVIKIQKISREGSKLILSVAQEKFTADGSPADPSFKWQVPINIVTSTGHSSSVLLRDNSMDIVVEDQPSDAWVKVNHNYVGYYRVQYPSEYMERFVPDINSRKLNELDRLGLLDDLMAMVQAGRVSTTVPLKLIGSGFKSENSYVVWRCINGCFGKLRTILADQDFFFAFKQFAISVMSNIADEIGWAPKEGEHHTRGLLRMIVLARMGVFGHEATVREARKRFKEHLSGENVLPADLRSAVYATVMANGDMETYESMLKLYNASDLHEEKDRVARAMSASQKPEVLEKVLQFSIGDLVRSQDTPFIVSAVTANPAGTELAWSFLKKNYDFFLDRYKSGYLMTRLVRDATSSFVTEEKALEVEKFFAEHPTSAERSVRQSVEEIRLNAAWRQRDLQDIKAFIANFN
jgi:puromycin-sensitive aminopeptidase